MSAGWVAMIQGPACVREREHKIATIQNQGRRLRGVESLEWIMSPTTLVPWCNHKERGKTLPITEKISNMAGGVLLLGARLRSPCPCFRPPHAALGVVMSLHIPPCPHSPTNTILFCLTPSLAARGVACPMPLPLHFRRGLYEEYTGQRAAGGRGGARQPHKGGAVGVRGCCIFVLPAAWWSRVPEH